MSGPSASLGGLSLTAFEAQTTAQYIQSFLDLVDNLPNDITRHLTQLHVLNNTFFKLMNRLDTNVDNFNKLVTQSVLNATDSAIDGQSVSRGLNAGLELSSDALAAKKRRLTAKLETLLVQIQEISDEKLKYSQLILDSIETKAKELDLDYEEVVRFGGDHRSTSSAIANTNGRDNNNSSINGNHNSNSNKLSVNNNNASSHSSTTNGVDFDVKDNKRSVNNEDNSSESRLMVDKRLLPRRACAVKINETTREVMDDEPIFASVPTKVTQNKTIKSSTKSTYSKSHNIGLYRVPNHYRDIARKIVRKQLPNTSRKIVSKMKDKRSSTKQSSTTSLRQNAKKSSRKSKLKRVFVPNNSGSTAAKPRVSDTTIGREVSKRSVNKWSNNSCSSTSSSASASSFSSLNYSTDAYDSPRKTSATNQTNGKREAATTSKTTRSATASNGNNSSHHNNDKRSSGRVNASHAATPTATTTAANDDNQFIGEPVDPNEPTYCLCGQVSYGEMICCDNESCPMEWFHFSCVRLSHKPKGKWFCPKCRKGDKYSVPKKAVGGHHSYHSAKD